MSIDEVIADIDALNGHVVRVDGFLPMCGGYDCPLYRSEKDARRAAEMFASRKRVSEAELPEFLGIGSDDGFDGKAASFVGGYVLITGKVDNRCRDHGKWACADRGPEIHPSAIQSWRMPSGTSAAPEKKA